MKVMISCFLALTILCESACDGQKRDVAEQPNSSWKVWSDRYSDKDYPVIYIKYRSGVITSLGREISEQSLINDFRRMSDVSGHPLVILLVDRGDINSARPLMDKISATGFCEDVGCYYKIVQ